MVAITVILAAVIGAFVLEIGDQQETAPSTSFSSEEAVKYRYETVGGGIWGQVNATEVTLTHAGGNTIDVTQFDIRVNGNNSVWGVEEENQPGSLSPLPIGDVDTAKPLPDIRPTLGSNEQVEFTSGESLPIFVHSAWKRSAMESQTYIFHYSSDASGKHEDGRIAAVWPKSNGNHEGPEMLRANDRVSIVWTAESGGKTQELFKYTVQTTSPEIES
jgi:hypothetical protein